MLRIGDTVKVLDDNNLKDNVGVVLDFYLGIPLVYFRHLEAGFKVDDIDHLHSGNVGEIGQCFYFPDDDSLQVLKDDLSENLVLYYLDKFNLEYSDNVRDLIKHLLNL